jgi:hypothetical protein
MAHIKAKMMTIFQVFRHPDGFVFMVEDNQDETFTVHVYKEHKTNKLKPNLLYLCRQENVKDTQKVITTLLLTHLKHMFGNLVEII